MKSLLKILIYYSFFSHIGCKYNDSPSSSCTKIGCQNRLNINMTQYWDEDIKYTIILDYIINDTECRADLMLNINHSSKSYIINIEEELGSNDCFAFELNRELPMTDNLVTVSTTVLGNSLEVFPESISYVLLDCMRIIDLGFI